MLPLELSNRCVIKLEGNDRKTFLQGLITNDINKVNPNSFLYAFFLSPQGRFLYDSFITERNNSLLLDCQTSRKEEIIKKLNFYKLKSQVTIEDASNQFKIYVAPIKINDLFSIDPRTPKLGFRAIAEGTPSTNDFDYERLRIENLIPDADKDFIYNKSFPLEYSGNELNAIDYNKGCYIGQELTARTHHRGVVRKKLYKLELNNFIPEIGMEIFANDKSIGIVLGHHNAIGLGLINSEEYEQNISSNKNFTVNGNPIKISR
jgi:folate-binding protein YgfZ